MVLNGFKKIEALGENKGFPLFSVLKIINKTSRYTDVFLKGECIMNYRNSEIKINDLINNLNKNKINLSPVFQRGHVWNTSQRRKLIINMISAKPIPAIFLYKEAKGSTYTYSILDGKQRIESVILFIGSQRSDDLNIAKWNDYFQSKRQKKDINFWINITGKRVTAKDLDDEIARNLGEYVIPIIEITMDDNTTLDQIISLFVDINQQGVRVDRFDIVKAICRNDPLLSQVFKLVANEERRREDVLYKSKKNSYTFVLKRLTQISKVKEQNEQVDRMWERLLEIAIFLKTKFHKKPVDILNNFINSGVSNKNQKLNKQEQKKIKIVFDFLKKIYSEKHLAESKLATDATQFYALVTALIDSDFIETMSFELLSNNIENFAKVIENPKSQKKVLKIDVRKELDEYIDLSMKHTTDPTKRARREAILRSFISGSV